MKAFTKLVTMLVFSLLCVQLSASQCLQYLGNEKKLIRLQPTLIRAEPQFLNVKDISDHILALIKLDPTSEFFDEINVTEIKYDLLVDKILFSLEFKAHVKALVIVFTKAGKFDFSDSDQIIGFSLDPLFVIKPPDAMSPQQNRDIDLWLIEFFKKSNLLETRSVFSF